MEGGGGGPRGEEASPGRAGSPCGEDAWRGPCGEDARGGGVAGGRTKVGWGRMSHQNDVPSLVFLVVGDFFGQHTQS